MWASGKRNIILMYFEAKAFIIKRKCSCFEIHDIWTSGKERNDSSQQECEEKENTQDDACSSPC
jgi:hypothetical protein